MADPRFGLSRVLPMIMLLLVGCATGPVTSSQTMQTSHSVVKPAKNPPPHIVFDQSIERPSSAGTGRSNSGDSCSSSGGEVAAAYDDDDLGADGQRSDPLLDEALEYCQMAQDFRQKGDNDSALDALDQAYSLILQVDEGDNPKLNQQKEDLRYMISKRIMEIYASRNLVVNGTHNEIPLIDNKYVQSEIDLFTTGAEKDFFQAAYQRSGIYRPMILEALKEAGLPEELSWLPLIESGFKVNALSSARALGLWQFIPSTGYKFGLNRDTFIDERIDPVKATKAAIAYLKELHGLFGDWTTVLAGYNCGEYRVLRVIREQNINYLDNFWDLYERLPNETARYVPRFLATLHIIKNLSRYGLDQVPTSKPIAYETVSVQRQVSLDDLAQSMGVSNGTLRELNPELRRHILPPTSYALRIPVGMQSTLLAQLDSLPTATCQPESAPRQANTTTQSVYHTVRRGETLAQLSRQYRTSIGSLKLANNLRNNTRLNPGQQLRIPQTAALAKRSAADAEIKRATIEVEAKQVRSATTHVVKKGETVYQIAKRYGTTPKKIQETNNLASMKLAAGQRIKIQAGSSSAPQIQSLLPPPPPTYQVKTGDSPFSVAQRHKISVERLYRINQLPPGSAIRPGQTLYVE